MSFTPVVRNSISIVKSLLEFAKDRKVDVKSLDFELISFQTLIKREKDLEFVLVEDTKTITREEYLDSATTLLQEYSIKIKPLKKTSKIKLTLATNKFKTKAIVTLLKGSILHKGLSLQAFKHLIWERKLKAGLFINVFEPKLDVQLHKILKLVPPDKPLSRDIKFTVALSIEPVPPVDAHVIKLYEQKNKNSESIVDCVDIHELILRYMKEKNGLDGRACNGKFLQMRTPITKNMLPICDTTIEVKEFEDRFEYFAKEDGYVLYEGGNVSISKTLKLNNADFRSTANIDGGESSKEISVEIAHTKSESEDGIGSGVTIDVKELKSSGSVGSNVNISAQELNIDAQTHKKSKIEVENSANIKLHRGDLVAKDAEIDVLESGKITAHNSIHIKQMLGGEAIAPIVKIDELLSNSTIIASELIEIQACTGANNTLIINPDKIESYHKDLEKLQAEHKNKNKEFQVEKLHLDEKLLQHTEQLDRIKTFQKRIISAQKSGKTPMKQDMIRIKEYKRKTLTLQEEQQTLEQKENELNTLAQEIDKMCNKDLHAKIISHTSYDGQSKVIFVNMQTKEEIIHIPEGKIETISLTLNSENEKVIKGHL